MELVNFLLNSLILADGFWHLTGQSNAGWPDWTIARVFNRPGMPFWFHRALGVFLITGSIWLSYQIGRGKGLNCYLQIYQNLVVPLTFTIIMVAFLLQCGWNFWCYPKTVMEAINPILIAAAINLILIYQN